MAIAKIKRFWIVWLTLPLICAALPVWGDSGIANLEQQLQAAVASSQWAQALQIIDRLIPLVPTQAIQLKQYRSKLEQLSRNSVSTSVKPQNQSLPMGLVPIKRRDHGVAVVEVTFNQRKTFEMLVDSGASLTIITQSMATALGITSAQVVQNVRFKTANGDTQLPIVYVNSVTVGGLTTTQVPVAIAAPGMEFGLLGQDFLQRYDVSLRSDRIEFHNRR